MPNSEKPISSSAARKNLGHTLNEHRALAMLVFLFLGLSVFAPNFFSIYNFRTILTGASLSAICAVGFTIIFILGQLDLSIGAVLMLSGMLCIGLQPSLGWTGSFLAAAGSGVMVGLVNGLLVSKAKINSFIVTLGTQIITFGLMHLYSDGGSKAVNDFRVADMLEREILWIFTPLSLITIAIVLLFALMMTRTRFGKGFFVVGGNSETAWLAGLNRDRYIIIGFIICDGLAAVGGALFAMKLASVTSYAILGNKTLLQVIAAVIIGGTLITGGKGDIVKSFFGVLVLISVNNGIGCFGLGFEVQMFVNGIILALVVLYEAYTVYKKNLLKGQRPNLLQELEKSKA
ncbi:MAG: ABC transporter permease [Spirochaetia bacterium]|nr:ABC transporter permease [Spirochaetia bacterium]